MFEIFMQAVWLILPAGVANMAPVLFKWLPLFNVPVDFGARFRGQPLFGAHKTYRGFLAGIFMAVLVVYIQQLLYPQMTAYSLINYSEINIWYVGFLLGFGALFGDMIESFFKRQVGIASGKSWAPFDQIDWILGGLIFISFCQIISWKVWIAAILLFGLLHPIVNLIGYYLGVKKNKF
ncbi:CDP-archaeol synthase [Patescibacteria group bacterium]|nr:CDP-archaeol synthase [Patescibacteria group bacterium]MBU1682642.1 CDP-archaeol synthase [Patescibacteria group bacterium]MBU1934826.1 CDP-archaeol synthase [Patescibacteria group bacterium]